MKIRAVAADTDEQLRVFAHVERSAQAFARVGLDVINAVCNKRRAELLPQMTQAFLTKHGLSETSPEQAKKELEAEFDLRALPEELRIDFSVPTYSVPERPMSASCPVVWVHMTAIDVPRLFCPSVGLSVEDATLHEMLHICGDVVGDGIVRHNWAGIIPIRQLLNTPVT